MDERHITFLVPGSAKGLVFEHSEEGRLVRISGGGRVYLDASEAGHTDFDGGFVTSIQTELPGGLLRTVRALDRTWIESFAWDSKGLLTEIDGVKVGYDDQQRVVSCRDGGGDWYYAYSGPHLSVIDSPQGWRQITRGEDGRPLAVRAGTHNTDIFYDSEGRRLPQCLKLPNWNRDADGRLWAVKDDEGRVVLTYLWDRFQCLGCIAGDIGGPLAMVFSLDPTGTPIRLITRKTIRRLARDAFGESLLSERNVPGLFGGAVCDGLVYLPFRRLDPFTGSYDAPDPMRGEETDPRRAAGYTGPLLAELPPSGPYTVCRNNPVTLADPTGGISDYWWFIPSSLTWSLQNTIGSLLGMWLNLEMSPPGMIASAVAIAKTRPEGGIFDIGGLSANNFDAFAIRSDGWLARTSANSTDPTTRTWTYQFLVNAPDVNFTRLEDARLFAPDSKFQPRLYGTILRCVPRDKPAFLLRGQRRSPNGASATDWSRNGAAAEPVIPGSRVPVFPSGGLHFDTVQEGVRAQTAEMVELEPSGALLSGTISQRALITLSGTGFGLETNEFVVASSSAGAVVVARVLAAQEENGKTLLRIDTSDATLGLIGIRVEGLSAPIGTETLTPIAGQTLRLSVAGSSNDYRPGSSVLRLNRSGAAVGFAKVTGLEAQLAIDEALPAALGNSLRVRPAVASPAIFLATLTANANVMSISTGTVPSPGTGVVVGSGGNAIAAIVRTTNGQDVTVDRALSALGGNGTSVPWQNLAPLPAVGLRSGAVETQSQITYAPDRAGTAPATGFVWVEGSGIATRRITAVNFDAIVLGQALPDALPAAFFVDRFTLQAPDVSGGTLTSAQVLALNAAPPSGAKAFHVIELAGAAVATGTPIIPVATGSPSATLTGDTAQVSINPTSAPTDLLPGQIVILQSGANVEAAAVARLRLTITMSRSLTLNANGLEAVLLRPQGLVYNAIRRGDRTFRVQPNIVGANTTDLPRFAIGELVRVTWTTPTAGERLYRIQFVNGTTITGAADEAVIPAAVTNLSVTLLGVQDAGSGSSRLGIDGEALSATQVRFSVWSSGAFNLGSDDRLGIVDGQNVFAVNLATGNQTLDIVFLTAPTLAGPLDISLPLLAAVTAPATASGFSTRFTPDGASLIFLDTPLTSPLTGLILTVPYIETTRRVNGNLNSGTVRVPDDHENVSIELNRRQALEDHELTHTQQSARLGPWLFAYFPLWVFELITEFASTAGMPEFGRYVPATVATGNSITIPAVAGVTIDADDVVQVAQSGRAETIRLGAKTGDVFALSQSERQKLSDKGMLAGVAQARREESGAVEALEFIMNLMQFFTVGGLMNIVGVAGWGGVIWVITMFIQWIRGLARNTITAELASDHITLTLTAGQRVDGLAVNSLLALEANNQTVVRPVQSISDSTVVLATAAPMTGSVKVSAYSTSSALFPFMHNYFPASFPDPNQPASLQVQRVGTETLTLAVHDRVHIRSSHGHSYNTVVTFVGADGLIQVEEDTLVSPGETDEFFIAKIGEDDPIGFSDQFLLNRLHLGWMQYLHDPWGQIVYRATPTSTVGKILAHSARYLFGTQSWSVLPALGYYFWDNALKQGEVVDATGTTLDSGGHRSHMEQEASHRSGDTYCPIGTLHGELTVVGDIGRYWLTEDGGFREFTSQMLRTTRQDTPGGAALQYILPRPTGGGTLSGLSVPETFSQLDPTPNLTGIGDRGWIPVNKLLERTTGAYVAFTRPGSYSVAPRTIPSLDKSLDAELNGFPNIVTHDQTVADVAVTLSTLSVAEGAAPIDLIPFQRAAFVVTPNGNRVYRATLTEPGAIATIENSVELVMQGIAPAAAPAGLATENVEISRFYRFNSATGAFDSGLGPVHLPADIDIAVRRLQIRLVDTVPLRATADPSAIAVTSLQPGGLGIILMPAPFLISAIRTGVTGTPALTPLITPLTPVPANIQAFIRDGGAVTLLIPVDQPPEAQAALTVTIPVGPPGSTAVPITCQVTVDPHFTLDSATGFNLSAASPLTLRSSDSTNIALVGTLNGITATPNNAEILLTVTTAPPGPQTILVVDTANNQRLARRTIVVT